MKTVVLSKNHCENCDHVTGKRTINIKHFKKNFVPLNKSALKIWESRKTKCWWCKKKPVLGETWGLSINPPEKNRVWCAVCAEKLEKELNEAPELSKAE